MPNRGFLLAILILVSSTVVARKIHFIDVSDVNKWEELVLLCRQKKVPLFVAHSKAGNMPSGVKEFQKNNASVKYVNKNFVSVYINGNSQLGQTFKKLFLLTDDNHYMVLNPQEELLLRKKKLSDAFFKEGYQRFLNFDELMKKHFKRQLTKEEWVTYLEIKYNNFGYLGTVAEANRFLPQLNESDLSNPEIWPFITSLCLDINNPVFQTIRNNKTLVENKKAKFPWLDYYISAYNLNLSFAINNKDEERIKRMQSELIPLFPDTSKVVYQHLLVEQQYLADLEEWEDYEKLTFDYLEIYNKPDDFYNEFEKLYYNYSFEKVSVLLEDILKAGIEQKSTFRLNYNMAQLCIAKGRTSEAWDYAMEAYNRAKGSKEQTKALILQQYLMY